jgi:AraC family transcriptional regulator, transcriptional activator of pobA
MENIPVKHIKTTQKEPSLSESFSIRDVRDMLDGKDMTQELHRHDFFFILVLKEGAGSHEIDFASYEVGDHSVFFMRPGQVHQLKLKVGCTGYLMQFSREFYYPNDKAAGLILRKASNKNLCLVGIVDRFSVSIIYDNKEVKLLKGNEIGELTSAKEKMERR